jgi:hypothetical protein
VPARPRMECRQWSRRTLCVCDGWWLGEIVNRTTGGRMVLATSASYVVREGKRVT